MKEQENRKRTHRVQVRLDDRAYQEFEQAVIAITETVRLPKKMK